MPMMIRVNDSPEIRPGSISVVNIAITMPDDAVIVTLPGRFGAGKTAQRHDEADAGDEIRQWSECDHVGSGLPYFFCFFLYIANIR